MIHRPAHRHRGRIGDHLPHVSRAPGNCGAWADRQLGHHADHVASEQLLGFLDVNVVPGHHGDGHPVLAGDQRVDPRLPQPLPVHRERVEDEVVRHDTRASRVRVVAIDDDRAHGGIEGRQHRDRLGPAADQDRGGVQLPGKKAGPAVAAMAFVDHEIPAAAPAGTGDHRVDFLGEQAAVVLPVVATGYPADFGTRDGASHALHIVDDVYPKSVRGRQPGCLVHRRSRRHDRRLGLQQGRHDEAQDKNESRETRRHVSLPEAVRENMNRRTAGSHRGAEKQERR